MRFSFEAVIYKVGINLCVDVPVNITKKMMPGKGYIPVKGKVKTYAFLQTLVPVKNSAYRLYVNGLMLKGADVKLGDSVKFTIERDTQPRTEPMHKELEKKLTASGLMTAFLKLTPGRQKEILRYLNNLKTEEGRLRNIIKFSCSLAT
jgi:Domain of unknown function (DUF1905)/Bacteriocin-protection, YdeI or OmpD-Associated